MKRVHPLRVYREANGISLGDLARRVGSTKASICRIEYGTQKPSPALAKLLRAATGIQLHEFRPDLWGRPGTDTAAA